MQLRAQMQVSSWNEQWARAQANQAKRQAQLKTAYNKEAKQKLAADRTREAQRALDGLETLLTSALEVDHAIDWSLLADNSDYPIAKPMRPAEEGIPQEPKISDPEFKAQMSFLTRIIPSLRFPERRLWTVRGNAEGSQPLFFGSKGECRQRGASPRIDTLWVQGD